MKLTPTTISAMIVAPIALGALALNAFTKPAPMVPAAPVTVADIPPVPPVNITRVQLPKNAMVCDKTEVPKGAQLFCGGQGNAIYAIQFEKGPLVQFNQNAVCKGTACVSVQEFPVESRQHFDRWKYDYASFK